MFWKWFWKVLATLLLVAIFVGGGIAIYRAGYAQGVSTNLRMAEDGVPVMPDDGLYYRPYVGHRWFFPGFGLFFGLILLFLLFGSIGRLARYSFWQSKGMSYPHYWGSGWHKHHHPDCRKPESHPDKPPSKGDAEDESASTA
jgi:hypothetical protein